MAEFIIATTDGTYSYNSLTQTNTPSKVAQITFDHEDNNSYSDTQGFLIKKQVGVNRVRARVNLILARADYEYTFIPMNVYDDTVEVTFDRNIPSKNSVSGRFVMGKPKIKQELPDNEYEIEFDLTEVIRST